MDGVCTHEANSQSMSDRPLECLLSWWLTTISARVTKTNAYRSNRRKFKEEEERADIFF